MHFQVLQKNNYTADDYAKEFGIKVNQQLALVDARVLPAPKVNVFLLFGVGK
jgi:eukaryotic translation initiation factor 2C